MSISELYKKADEAEKRYRVVLAGIIAGLTKKYKEATGLEVSECVQEYATGVVLVTWRVPVVGGTTEENEIRFAFSFNPRTQDEEEIIHKFHEKLNASCPKGGSWSGGC